MVLHRPTDPYGDGYVHLVQVELVDSGLSARGVCSLQGQGAEDLAGFLVGLADAWRGWTGVKSWTSLGAELAVEATHDGGARVTMAVTLRRPRQVWEAYRPPDESATWSARLLLTVEAGEELAAIAQQAQTTLRPAAPKGPATSRRNESVACHPSAWYGSTQLWSDVTRLPYGSEVSRTLRAWLLKFTCATALRD